MYFFVKNCNYFKGCNISFVKNASSCLIMKNVYFLTLKFNIVMLKPLIFYE